jgi:hypothetical protein
MRTLTRLTQTAALALGLSLAGCANVPAPTEASLTYESKPLGATIFEGGQSLGVAPVTRTYKQQGTSATIRTPDVTAVWPSGAKSVYYTLLPVGADLQATIERPAGAPGLQADLDNANQVVLASEREKQRNKDALARDMARNSQRCKDQMAKGNLATNDC